MRSAAALGAFTVERRIGVGGMGEVWAGRHRDQAVPVAIKFLPAHEARQPEYVAAFRSEVHAVARLSHPGIIGLLDCGVVPEAPALQALGLESRVPYLVMRRASHGALAQATLPLPWPQVRGVLLRLLDALAHAHARGVIHRDIKPENVLVHEETGAGDEPRQQLWLSDFGIAHLSRALIDSEDESRPAFEDGSIVGTPGYMAPEQLRGAVREQGPWTDLYALGCLAWSLLMGRPPFDTGKPMPALLLELMTAELPPLPETVAPPGVSAWIARLTANDPQRRFQRAADAAAAFPGRGAVGTLAIPIGEAPPPAAGDSTTIAVTVGEALTTLAALRGEIAVSPSSPPPRTSERLPFPESWRRPTLPPPALPLVGAGLALHGLKPPPLCGRHAERDQLWEALRGVVTEGRPAAILIRGAAGVGKSRLAQWLAQRAHEVGACSVVEVTHGPTGGPGDGLAAALARHLRCTGLPYADLLATVREWVAEGPRSAEYEALALATWLAPSASDAPEPAHTFATPTERDEVVRRLLERLASERPLLLWLDDLQWAPDTLRFLRGFLGRSAAPVLVVGTIQEEALADSPESAERLDALERETIQLGPLSEEDHLRLVRHMLRLAPELAREVALKTQGNPLFVGQLMSEWIARGALRITDDGFELETGVAVAVPTDLRAMWSARLDRLLEGRSPSHRRALELAATLGLRVDRHEWRRACALAGDPLDEEWVQTLVVAQVLERRGRDVAFVHGLLRSMIETDAAPRAAELHGVALQLLEGADGGDPERRGHHLAALGRHAEAAGLLLEAARDRIGTCDYTRAAALLDRRDASLDALDVATDDSTRVAGDVVRAWLLRLEGRLDRAEALATSAHERATDDETRSLCELRLGEIALRRGYLRDASRWLTPARDAALARGDMRTAALIQWNLAWVQLLSGRPVAAEKLLTPLIALTRGPGWSAARQLHVLWATGIVQLTRGRLTEAEAIYRGAEALSEAHGDNRLALAHARFGLGAIAERRGQLAEAERLAGIAFGHYDEIQASERHFATHLLGRVRRARGDAEGARVLLERARAEAAGSRPLVEARFLAAMLPLEASEERWDPMRDHLRAAVALTEATGSVDFYSGEDAALAATLAERAGLNADAAALRGFAATQNVCDDPAAPR